MHQGLGLFAAIILTCWHVRSSTTQDLHDGSETAVDFSNEWIVQFDRNLDVGSREVLVTKLGYEMVGEVPGLKDYHVIKKLDQKVSDRQDASLHSSILRQETTILWTGQVFRLNREHRSSLNFKDLDQDWPKQKPGRLKAFKSDNDAASDRGLEDISFNDEYWKSGKQWYMVRA